MSKVDRKTGAELADAVAPDELLVHAHRDNHPVEMATQFLASRLIELTGSETLATPGIRTLDRLGRLAASAVGRLTASPDRERRTKQLLGVAGRDVKLRFKRTTELPEAEVKARIRALQEQARARLAARGPNPRLHVLLTGATGFLGKELLAQMAEDHRVEEVVAIVRPEKVRDHRTGAVVRLLSPRQRGALLLRRLHVRAARKFRFVRGDIEKPGLGVARSERLRLRQTLTHVVHCAASVAFDDSYEASFRANVLGSRNALAFSLDLQRAPGSPFIGHVAIETSYIHGRHAHSVAQESAFDFPKRFYNNFYEVTKAMASLETDRALVDEGLCVTQILPSIVIGHSRTGNNRGDTKVVNAPINAFGRAKLALDSLGGSWPDRARAWLVATLATMFPADRSAELNLVPVDRVAQGIVAALYSPEAVGSRIHLATDNRIRAEEIARITGEELGVRVRRVDPTLTRNLTLPLVKALLRALGEAKLASLLERLGGIFGVYSEWGQPIHDVGNDVRLLGLPKRRPDTAAAFRMLCRHNKYVQEFGRVRDPDELARRERIWAELVDEIEFDTGRGAAFLRPAEFERRLMARVSLHGFRPR